MSDLNEHDKSSAAPTDDVDAPRDPSRRRFARAGAAAPVVLGSLISKPVLAVTAKQMYHCTTSGKMSGNLSSHPHTMDCRTLGRSPGYWKNNGPWPTGTIKGTLNSGMCTQSGTTTGTRFNGFSSGSAVLADAFRFKSVSSVCTVYDRSEGSTYTGISSSNKATFLQILNTGGGLNETSLKALGRATVASVLNAIHFGADYPLTPAKVIAMFNAVYMGGTYQVNATTAWNANQVKDYFESLYGIL
jgi:hypothetical protein